MEGNGLVRNVVHGGEGGAGERRRAEGRYITRGETHGSRIIYFKF
jgi:hypothetical protein